MSFASCDYGTPGSYTIDNSGYMSKGVTINGGSFGCPTWLKLEPAAVPTQGVFTFRVKPVNIGSGAVRLMALLETGDSNANDASLRLRIFNDNRVAWNVGAGDGVAPDVFSPNQAELAPVLTQEQWYCYELEYNNSENYVRVYVDNEELPGMALNYYDNHYDDRLVGGGFSLDVTALRLGGQNDGGTGVFVYDDLKLSAERVGCD